MASSTFTVNKANTYTEVAKTTSYTGAKLAADGSAYEQVFTTDEDRLLLERFWNEACNAMTDIFKPWLTSVSSAAESHGVSLSSNYSLTADMPTAFDSNLVDSIKSSMFSFFVNYIVGQWYKFANKAETEEFLKIAAAMMDDVKAKVYYRKKPTRISPV